MKRTVIAMLLTAASLSVCSETMAAEVSVNEIEEAVGMPAEDIPEAYESEEPVTDQEQEVIVPELTAEDNIEALIPEDKKRPAGFTADTWKGLKLVNKERHKAGAEPLSGFKEFQDMAALRTKEIMKKFSHTRPNGEICSTAYPLDGFSIAENIAAGQESMDRAIEWWMNSPGHKRNMLNPVYVHISIGASDRHYVQGFARPDSGHEGIEAIYVLDKQRIMKKKGKISSLGIVVMVKSPTGYSYLPLEDYMCSGYDPAVEGLYDVTVSIRGCETTFPLIVSANGKNITINELPAIDMENSAYAAILATGQTMSPELYRNNPEEIAKYVISSGNKNITLSKKGKVKGKKAGDAVITTYVKDGYIYRANEQYLIHIVNPKFAVKTINLTVDSIEDASGLIDEEKDFSNVTYISSNPKIAAVDPETGIVTGIKKGSAKITLLLSNGESTVKRAVKVKVKTRP